MHISFKRGKLFTHTYHNEITVRVFQVLLTHAKMAHEEIRCAIFSLDTKKLPVNKSCIYVCMQKYDTIANRYT
jgi:hypothetical protein